MSFFRQNPFIGWLVAIAGVCALAAAFFLFRAKGGFNEALARFSETALEKNRLEGGNPFPNDTNLRKMKTHTENYVGALEKLKAELKTRVLPVDPIAPNEFQSRLRQAVNGATERARVNKVKLPESFYLGFEEYASALPNTAVAPLLGQQLAQAERVLNMLIDARVDAVTAFRRTPLASERGAAPSTSPSPSPGRKPSSSAAQSGPKLVEPNTVDITFAAAPSVVRKILNQLAASSQQFYAVRTLHVRNEKEKGPPRQQSGAGDSAAAQGGTADATQSATGKPPSGNLNFIVGNEHIEVSAKIEMLRFNL